MTHRALFLANKGKRYVPGKLSDMASQYVTAGFDRTGACHLYRHNTATTMLDNVADLRHVQEMLDHASLLTTQLYTHVSRKKLTQVYNDIHRLKVVVGCLLTNMYSFLGAS